MTVKRIKICIFAVAATIAAIVFGLAIAPEKIAHAAMPESAYAFNELYRDQLSFSPEYGWNNDPNGLLYANGTYHMYYQYNYDKRAHNALDSLAGSTDIGWGNMSWGHATSVDLVHWEERPVAIPAYINGDDGKFYEMMFSGSAVFDENNTSGLFDTDESGRVVDGQGIVAVLTQPSDADGGQRQVLAYSRDNGESFSIKGEILGANGAWSLGDGEFRDPKVFRSDEHGKWLMAVGGGAVRMFASENLLDWEYIGDTGYWGECPDISRYTVDGEVKYALVMSPEDKPQSHEHNGTDRQSAYYPAEYYVIGSLNDDGLFVGETPVTRLTQGIDCYAIQTFNNAPDGKVYGVSWSASWKTVGDYARFRENYNGGMTVVYELNIVKTSDGLALAKTPVDGLKSLRRESIAHVDGTVKAGEDPFAGKKAVVADIQATLDFSSGDAMFVTLELRKSVAERVSLTYDVAAETLTLDRSESSLAAKNLPLYAVRYTAKAPLDGKKLDLRILSDRGSISVFAANGAANIFSAVFPCLHSDGIELVSDGDISLVADVYSMASIFGELPNNGTLYMSTDKIDTVVGRTEYFSASVLADGFSNKDVVYTVVEDENDDLLLPEDFEIVAYDGYVEVTVNYYGHGRLKAEWNGQSRYIDFYVYDDVFESDIAFTVKHGGTSYLNDDGLFMSSGTSDAFVYSAAHAYGFDYSATVIPADGKAQAGALVFGVSDDFYDYFVATVDYTDKMLKLWRAGVGDIAVKKLYLPSRDPVTIKVEVVNAVARIYLPELNVTLVQELDKYAGGMVGLNVYNANMTFNDVRFVSNDGVQNADVYVGEREIWGVVNITDANAIVHAECYTVDRGFLTLTDDYMLSLPGGKEYTFKVFSERDALYFTKKSSVNSLSVSAKAMPKGKGIELLLDGAATVKSVYVGDVRVEFIQNGNTVVIEPAALTEISDGEHYVSVYSDMGRAETLATLYHEYWGGVNLALVIPLCIVCVLLVGGAAALFAILYRKNKNKEQ